MTLDEARKALKDAIQGDNSLHNTGWYLDWSTDENTITLDGVFEVEDLEAIVEWVKAYRGT